MTNESLVFCKKYQEKKTALSKPPFFGPLGEKIKNNICAEAWQEWQEMQIKIINEERLDLSEKNAQERLLSAMIGFLNLDL